MNFHKCYTRVPLALYSMQEDNWREGVVTVLGNNRGFLPKWVADDPGYLFISIIVTIGVILSLIGAILTPDVDDVWDTTNATVLEGTEWLEFEVEEENCLYDEEYDEYYDCIYSYSYDCKADVSYNYTVSANNYYSQDRLSLGNWEDSCLEVVKTERLPVNSIITVWYKINDNSISQLNQPLDVGYLLFGISCCGLIILLCMILFMKSEGNNDQYHSANSDASNASHHRLGGGVLGGVYHGSAWHRRPWFHRRRSMRASRRGTGNRNSNSVRRRTGRKRKSR